METLTEEQILEAAQQANKDQRDLVERVKKSRLETPIEGKDENPPEDEN
jgi:hypothetical protein